MRAPCPEPMIASPLKTSPLDEWSMAVTAWAALIAPFHPAMMPPLVANRYALGAAAVPAEIAKPAPVCRTMPVGLEAGDPTGPGTPMSVGDAAEGWAAPALL